MYVFTIGINPILVRPFGVRSMRSRLFLLLILLGGFLCAAVEHRPAPVPVPTAPQIYRSVLHGVAWVHASGSGKGTGWIVDRERRWLVTCAHVVGDNSTVEVVFPVSEKGQVVAPRAYYLEHYPRLQKEGYVVRGKVLHLERDTDLALVELASLPTDAIELSLAGEAVLPGDRVYAIGTRYDSDALWGFSAGSVRGPRVMREGYYSGGKELAKGARVIEATDPINEGDSGGPLVNGRGEVVGVCAAVEWKAHGAGLFTDRSAVLVLLERAGQRAKSTRPPVFEPSAGREVYRRAIHAVALVQGTDSKLQATGWVVDRQRRLLLTTAEFVGRNEKVAVTFAVHEAGHVVSDGKYYRDNERQLRDQGRRVVGCILATDAHRNLALLELASFPEDVMELRMAAETPAPGESVHTVGNPQGTGTLWLYNGGWVRQSGHANLGQTTDGPDPALVLTQMNVSEGEAGAPLLDDRAELVGVLTGKSAAQQQIATSWRKRRRNGSRARRRNGATAAPFSSRHVSMTAPCSTTTPPSIPTRPSPWPVASVPTFNTCAAATTWPWPTLNGRCVSTGSSPPPTSIVPQSAPFAANSRVPSPTAIRR